MSTTILICTIGIIASAIIGSIIFLKNVGVWRLWCITFLVATLTFGVSIATNDIPKAIVCGGAIVALLLQAYTFLVGLRLAPATKTKSRTDRLRENGGSHTEGEWRSLCNAYRNRCAKCKRKAKLTRDHVIPVIFGGSDDISNIQPLCLECNVTKGMKTTDYRSITQ